ncbi:MAG: hypothetical protein EOM20_12105 [Spartobacteria bacterium]|nr:hypothetical protein [Spartobacteria bacterium]
MNRESKRMVIIALTIAAVFIGAGHADIIRRNVVAHGEQARARHLHAPSESAVQLAKDAQTQPDIHIGSAHAGLLSAEALEDDSAEESMAEKKRRHAFSLAAIEKQTNRPRFKWMKRQRINIIEELLMAKYAESGI